MENESAVTLLSKAVGRLLKHFREQQGLSRTEVCESVPTQCSDRTLLAYEHGYRNLTVQRLHEYGQVLGVPGSQILAMAEVECVTLSELAIRVDLRKLASSNRNRVEFPAVQRWARNRLKDAVTELTLTPGALRELAAMADVTHERLAEHLIEFPPIVGNY